MNFEQARGIMVENQLRPNKINKPEILNIFLKIEKEMFLSENLKGIAYSDVDIDLISKRGYLKNLHIAQLLQYSNINKTDNVLHIGALTGYVTCILSKLSNKVIAIENNDELFQQLKNNIDKLKLKNIEIYNDNLKTGFKEESPYSLIFIDNPITNIPNEILDQLSTKRGRIIMIKKISDNLGKGMLIIKNDNNFNKEILFDTFSKFELYENIEEFEF